MAAALVVREGSFLAISTALLIAVASEASLVNALIAKDLILNEVSDKAANNTFRPNSLFALSMSYMKATASLLSKKLPA